MIDILDRELGFDPRDLHGLKFQHDHRAGGILGQGLINLQADFFSWP
jgi:hypothetical protein